MRPASDLDALKASFERAAPDHFEWQTRAPVVASRERSLIEAAFLPAGNRLLDLGCGEGATLFHLGAPSGATGVDLFPEKVAFAARALPACRFHQASVYELPFDDGGFDHVLIRDLIHHLDDPDRCIRECARVLEPGGRIDVLEPCRYNPLVFVHALTHRAEHGELRSTEAFLRHILEPRFRIVQTQHLQAFPLHRLLFHPKLGSPSLARIDPIRAVVAVVERAAELLVPRFAWAYVHVRGVLEG